MNGPQDGYDSALSAIRNHVDDLGVWVMIWETRQEDAPNPHARRCASDAVDAIDGALAELHKVQQLLITEIRVSDDATAARVDALLADRDHERPGPDGRGDTGPGARDARPHQEGEADEHPYSR